MGKKYVLSQKSIKKILKGEYNNFADFVSENAEIMEKALDKVSKKYDKRYNLDDRLFVIMLFKPDALLDNDFGKKGEEFTRIIASFIGDVLKEVTTPSVMKMVETIIDDYIKEEKTE